MKASSGIIIIALLLFFLWLYDTGRWTGIHNIIVGGPGAPTGVAPGASPSSYTPDAIAGATVSLASEATPYSGNSSAVSTATAKKPGVQTGSNTLNSIIDTAGSFLGGGLGGLLSFL